jgi:hypothetical protein
MISSTCAHLRWIERDGKVIILARGLRTFAQGFIVVILALHLTRPGFMLAKVGFFSALVRRERCSSPFSLTLWARGLDGDAFSSGSA